MSTKKLIESEKSSEEIVSNITESEESERLRFMKKYGGEETRAPKGYSDRHYAIQFPSLQAYNTARKNIPKSLENRIGAFDSINYQFIIQPERP